MFKRTVTTAQEEQEAKAKTESLQRLFEDLRIAAREDDPEVFENSLQQLSQLSERQLTDLLEIIVCTQDRQHLLLFFFEAEIDLNAKGWILELLANEATEWRDPITRSVVTLMALGIPWSFNGYDRRWAHNYESGSFEIDGYSCEMKLRDRAFPITYYQIGAHNHVARLRGKIHSLFHSDHIQIKKVWDFIHELWIFACANGLIRCAQGLLEFTWPAKILTGSESPEPESSREFIESLSKPATFEELVQAKSPENEKKAETPEKAKVERQPGVNTEPLLIPQTKVDFDDIQASLLAKVISDEAKIEACLHARGVKRIVPRPFMHFIDVNYRDKSGNTAYKHAMDNYKREIIELLIKIPELVGNSVTEFEKLAPEDSLENFSAKILSAIKLNQYPKFKNWMNKKPNTLDSKDIQEYCQHRIEKIKRKCSTAPFFARKYDEQLRILKEFFNHYHDRRAAKVCPRALLV